MKFRALYIKLALIFALLLILYGLFIYYNANYEINAPDPSLKTILSSYPQGETVVVDGDVVSVHHGGFYLKDYYKEREIIFNVNSSTNVAITDKVSVLGELGPSYTIYASKVLVHKKWKEDFILIRSALAGLVLGIIFLIYWKFDPKILEFVKRREK